MIEQRRISLFLPDPDNPYEQLLAREAEVACGKHHYDLAVEFARDVPQVRQIHAAASAPPAKRPDVIMVMPIQEAALKSLCEHALVDGIGWVFLNRLGWNLGRLRTAYQNVPVGFVAPDQKESGRIQGRQLRALLPAGGEVLYVKGRTTNTSAEDRMQGLMEALAGCPVRVVATLDGSWTTAGGERAVESWLLSQPRTLRLGAIACQNDLMAIGAVKVISRLKSTMPQLGARLPVLGCDGLPGVGKRLVDEGILASTIVLPATTARAIGLVSHFYTTRAQLPPRALLQPEPYPLQQQMVARWASRVA